MLLLDAGNALSGVGGLTEATQGRIMVESMDLMGYDAMALGGLDLRLGPTVLGERAAEAGFAMLSANTFVDDEQERFVEPYRIIQMAGHRIGIIGLTEPLGRVAGPTGDDQDFLIKDPFDDGLSVINELADQVDILIALSHMGQALDEQLAAQVPAVDVIIGGRDGKVMRAYRYQEDGPIMTQMGTRGQIVGLIALSFDADGAVTQFDGQLYLMTDDYAEDVDQIKLRGKYVEY